MKFPKDQPFWTSVILHLVVLIALFLATIVETFKPREKPHVFEMVTPPGEQSFAAAPAPAPPVPDMTLPELEPVPEVAPVPRPLVRAPAPKPPAPRPAPAKPKPKILTQEDFIRQFGAPQPRQQTRPTPQRPTVTVPSIDVPELVVPSNPSSSATGPRPLTQQQQSALGSYSAQLRSRLDAAWGKPSSLAGARIAATAVFNVSASGRITNVQLRPGSGNAAFDQSVLAAFRKVTYGGPTPTGQGHSFSMTFRMTD